MSHHYYIIAAQCEDGDVKLLQMEEGVGVAQARMGIVLVCSNKRWGTICNSNTQANLRTVCWQLGYSGGEQYSQAIVKYH